ncbi:bifunctional (p)ppGpp synthetase/guanosine-3',5'-bis(diphosphate) 3'-pyrophosphohydrolase [Proteinivorax hydrogeniformans]|uniref:GTP diphosphokinase n=1 Tax=Proteinivorax hydrogeniformans TaxID=1826727 RepID=A0AAU8HXB3_9FIRM
MENIKENVRKYDKRSDLLILDKAFALAHKAHSGQKRESGDSFIVHPLEVATILTKLEMDVDTIAAALLHDVVEDTSVTIEEVKQQFGSRIAQLVDGVTKLKKINFKSKEEQQAESFRKMFMAMATDIRVIIIKLADRLHNMRTLSYCSEEKQKRMAKETMDIYAPLANRLGIFKVKWELEDLAFRHTKPKEYYNLVEQISQKREEREAFIKKIIDQLRDEAVKAGINADIGGRPKHLYSIYQKMDQKGKQFNEIYDLTAVRIIVNSVKECYGILGIIHSQYKPIPGRFKDYIAMPKPNMYQSLHTTVLCPKGNPLEIQIRTWDMHRTAEYGIAAHWRYKEGTKINKQFEEKLSWFRQFMEWQNDLNDAREYMESLKIDLFDDEVFVFTPKGDVIDLPKGAVPVDFAYRIHTDIGHRFKGAKVNGGIVSADHRLTNGDIIEIITKKEKSPSRDWLKYVKTSHAKTKIRQWFKKEKLGETIERGKELLDKEVEKLGFEPEELILDHYLSKIIERYNYSTANDLYAAVGNGSFSANSIAKKLEAEYQKEFPEKEPTIEDLNMHKEKKAPQQGVSIKGVDNLLLRFSKCCNPVPGDDIVGYITKGRGVSIHRSDCVNVNKNRISNSRLLEVSWDEQVSKSYPASFSVYAWDRPGLLKEVMNVVTESKADILSVNGKGKNDGNALVSLTIEVEDIKHLSKIKDRIKSIQSVYSIRRQGTRSDV